MMAHSPSENLSRLNPEQEAKFPQQLKIFRDWVFVKGAQDDGDE